MRFRATQTMFLAFSLGKLWSLWWFSGKSNQTVCNPQYMVAYCSHYISMYVDQLFSSFNGR